jgi:hypothetical protein
MPRVLGAVRAAATISAATCNAADFSSSIEGFMAGKYNRAGGKPMKSLFLTKGAPVSGAAWPK